QHINIFSRLDLGQFIEPAQHHIANLLPIELFEHPLQSAFVRNEVQRITVAEFVPQNFARKQPVCFSIGRAEGGDVRQAISPAWGVKQESKWREEAQWFQMKFPGSALGMSHIAKPPHE